MNEKKRLKRQMRHKIKMKGSLSMTLSKGLSIMLTLTLLAGVLLVPSFANVQYPVDSVTVDNVYYIVGEDQITGESLISPTMTVSWDNPEEWASATDPADEHDPDFYEIDVENLSTGVEDSITVTDGSTRFSEQLVEIHENVALDTGSLYQITVNPYHYHEDDDGIQYLADQSGLAEYAYAVTDPSVEFESDEDSITVIWENYNVPDFEYRIVYALGDYSSLNKQTLVDNKEGEITGITVDSDDVTLFYDSVDKRNKFSYTIDENIYPGQVYSIIVEVTSSYFEGEAITRNVNYPVINTVSTNIELSYVEIGDQLKLQWEIPATFRVGSDSDEYELTETRIMNYRDGQGQTLAILYDEAGTVGYYTIEQPDVETGYQLELLYEAVDDESKPDIEPISNYLTYSPTLVEVVPTKPEIPTFISEEILEDLRDNYTTEEVRDILADEYLVSGSTYSGSLDDFFDAEISFHLDQEDEAFNLVWSSFRRIDIDETSDTYGEYITDLSVYYDVWATNSYESLTYATNLYTDLRYSSTDTDKCIYNSSDEVVGFHESVDAYYDADTGQMESMRANQIYYLKVRAKKIVGDEEIYSEPTIVTVYYTDDGASYEPPLVTVPPLRLKDDDSTTTSLTIAWKEEWWEVIDLTADDGDALDGWQTEIWIDDDGNISNIELDDADYYPVYLGEDYIDELQDALTDLGSGITLQSREIDMGSDPFGISNVYYKFYKVEYETVKEAIEEGQETDADYSFLEYFDELVQNDKDGTAEIAWVDIDTEVNPDDTTEIMYEETGLLPNTSYMFVLYPYRILYETTELYAHYPTPIIVATEPEEVEVNPDPTVPSMYVTDATDRTITLSWEYNTDFEYEIVYSTDDTTDDTTSVPIELPDNLNDPLYPVNGEYYEVTATDLFPNTSYYFFIRASQTETSTTSSWSNPVYGITDDVPLPDPPLGVGIAADSVMEEYGYDTGVSDEYIAISWLLDVEDTDDLNDDTDINIYYSYILEAANNDSFIDPVYVVSGSDDYDDTIVPDSVELLDKNLAKINSLISNRYYYFRMKTRVTVVGTEEDQLIVKESEYYSTAIRIITEASDNEYDSTSDPAVEILPSDNYEMIYDGDNFELTYRFRDDSTDSDGYADNNVDQRLISDLVERNLYEYEIDISGYDNKPITSRVVRIPYSILEAFDSYEVELVIDAGDMEISVPHDALLGEVNRQKNQYGVSPTLEITIEDVDGFTDEEQMPEDALTAVSIPQEIGVRVTSDRANTTLKYSNQPLEIALNTSSRYAVYNKEPVVYSTTANGSWEEVDGSYSKSEGAYLLSTKNVGSYGVYLMEGSSEVQSTNPGHWSEKYKDSIDNKYTIEGLSSYNPDAVVSEDELINIIYQVVSNEKEIDVSAYVNSDKLNALYYSGVKEDKTSGATTIKREEAIAMMMAAFEIRDNITLVANTNVKTQVYNNSSISSEYKDMIAKAASYGLISDLNSLRPNANITYGELFALWSRAEDL